MFDWVVKIKPDVLFVYPLRWPPNTANGANFFAPLNWGKFGGYPWSESLTAGMMASGPVREGLIETMGLCPNETNRKSSQKLRAAPKAALKKATQSAKSFNVSVFFFAAGCIATSDHTAAMTGTLASAYFNYPERKVESRYACDPSLGRNRHAEDFYEVRIMARLRRAGARFYPMDFSYVLPPPSQGLISHKMPPLEGCNTSIPEMAKDPILHSLPKCLTALAKHTTVKEMKNTLKFRHLPVRCLPQ